MANPETVNEIDTIDDLEFERRTLAAIVREFGLGGLARFIRLNRSGTGDYTAERQQWVESLTVDDILRDLDQQASQPHPKG